jgi:hypothetical protein
MWQDRENWPKHMDQKTPVIRPEVWGLIDKAMAVAKARNESVR